MTARPTAETQANTFREAWFPLLALARYLQHCYLLCPTGNTLNEIGAKYLHCRQFIDLLGWINLMTSP